MSGGGVQNAVIDVSRSPSPKLALVQEAAYTVI